MFPKLYTPQLFLFVLALPLNCILGGPVSSPEITAKTGKTNNVQQQHQQQQHQQHQQNQHKSQEAHLNSLNVYANNYDMLGSNHNTAQGNENNFKASYKLPDMETNFTPIQNGNSIAPEYVSHMSSASPVLMQYLPQTINEGGVQYLQLIPTRPLIVPIGPYMAGHSAGQSLGYTQTITAPHHALEYSARPLLSAMPVNMPPPSPAPLVEVPSHPLPAYGIQSYAAHLQPYKQNYRINRETKDRQILGPLSLNMNEYLPGPQAQVQTQQAGFVRGRP